MLMFDVWELFYLDDEGKFVRLDNISGRDVDVEDFSFPTNNKIEEVRRSKLELRALGIDESKSLDFHYIIEIDKWNTLKGRVVAVNPSRNVRSRIEYIKEDESPK